MRKTLLGLLILFVLILLVLFIVYQKKDGISISEFDDITVIIKEDSLTKTGLTLIVTDLSENKNEYSEWYRIDKKINNKWKKLRENSEWFNLITYFVGENNELEFKIDWSTRYGTLNEGDYRLIKKVNQEYIAIEFAIR